MAEISKLNLTGSDLDIKDNVARQKLTVIDPTEGEGLITFGVDANGNYGYKKVGADTVTPFLTGGGYKYCGFVKLTSSARFWSAKYDVSFSKGNVKEISIIENEYTGLGTSNVRTFEASTGELGKLFRDEYDFPFLLQNIYAYTNSIQFALKMKDTIKYGNINGFNSSAFFNTSSTQYANKDKYVTAAAVSGWLTLQDNFGYFNSSNAYYCFIYE